MPPKLTELIDLVGRSWKAGAAELTKILGAPRMKRRSMRSNDFKPVWTKVIDPARAVRLRIEGKGDGSVDGFCSSAWAISRDLLDVARFPEHRDLIAKIKAKKAPSNVVSLRK